MGTKEMILDTETGEVIDKPEEVITQDWYRRPANFVMGQFNKDMENTREKSMTVPDEAYTVREVLEKFSRGLPLNIVSEGSYDNPEDFENESFENAIDITDVEEQVNVLNTKIAEAKQSKVKGVVKGAEVKPPDITEVKKADKNEEEV